MSATYALGTIVRRHGDVDDFEALAAEMISVYGGLSTLQLAPKGVITRIHPLRGNEKALGHDLLADPDRRFEAREALRTRRLTLAGPFELKQGGVGLVGRLPVFVPGDGEQPGERFWGFVTALVRLPDLIAASGLRQLAESGYAWELSRVDPEHGERRGFARSGPSPVEPVTVSVAVPNGEWQLAISPTRGWRDTGPGPLLTGLLLAIALLFAGFAFALLRHPDVLRREVAARTSELATERERLASSEMRFRALTERSTDMILVLDAGARVVQVSASVTEATGRPARELVGQEVFDLVQEEDRARASEAFRALVAAPPGATARLTVRSLHRDGSSRFVETIGRNLLRDPAVGGIVLNSRDVTEQRRLEEQFREAQKLESLGRLAGGIAHDFNNLVTVIPSCSEALREEAKAGSTPSLADVDEVHAAGLRARDLTRQLLAFARRQVIAPVSLDVGEVIAGSERLLRRVLGEDVALSVQRQPGLWPVLCDPAQLEQVVVNLAVNARDAMPKGGALTIETSNLTVAPGDARCAAFPGMEPGDWVSVAVHDTGSGMAPEVAEHVFEPFFTTKEVGKGTGLGLSMVYGFVRQSGGFIRVESAVGHGTSFQICFPRTSVAREVAAPAPPPPVARGSGAVLLVEDDAGVRSVGERLLRKGGYRVLVASGGAEALELADRAQEALDLVITDVVMPGMDGWALAQELRRRHPRLKVLFVSGYTREAVAQRGLRDPDVSLLEKPYTPAGLLERVRAILAG